MTAAFIYITVGNQAEAASIGRTLVEERLVACANVIDGITSFYWWDGAVNEDREVLLVAKTRESLVDEVIARVKSLHSYDCPCVVSWPIANANPDYLAWIENETRP